MAQRYSRLDDALMNAEARTQMAESALRRGDVVSVAAELRRVRRYHRHALRVIEWERVATAERRAAEPLRKGRALTAVEPLEFPGALAEAA